MKRLPLIFALAFSLSTRFSFPVHAEGPVAAGEVDYLPGSFGGSSGFVMNGGFVAGQLHFILTPGANPAPVTSLVATIDGVTPLVLIDQPAPEAEGYGEYVFDVSSYEGSHVVVVEAYDEDGGYGRWSGNFIFDQTPPSCVYVYPLTPDENAWIGGNVSFQVLSEDPLSGVEGVVLQDPAFPGLTHDYSPMGIYWAYLDYSTFPLPEGTTLVHSLCFDRAGNVAEARDLTGNEGTEIKVDNTPPAVSMDVTPVVPYGGRTIARGVVAVNTTADDGAGSGVVSQTIELDGATVSHTVNTALYNDGDHLFSFTAADVVGNIGTTSTEVTFDNTPPMITIEDPTEGEIVTGFLNQILVTFAEPHGVFDIKVLLDGEKVDYTQSGNTFTLDTPVTQNGEHVIVVMATDAVGNEGESDPRHFVLVGGIGGGGGALDVKFIVPKTSHYLSGSSLLLAQISGEPLPPTGYFRVDGVNRPDVPVESGTVSDTLDTRPYPDGSHVLDVIAGAVDTVTVVFDNTPPAITSFDPAEGSIVSGTIMIQGAASDNLALKRLKLYIDGVFVKTTIAGGAPTATISYSWNTALESVGTHALRLEVQDKAGNMVDHTYNVTILPPAGPPLPGIEIILPSQENQPIGGLYTIMMRVTGAPLTSAGFRVDGGPFLPATLSGADIYSHVLNTPAYVQGFHNITYVATNITGLTSVSRRAYFDNTAPTVSFLKPTPGQVLFMPTNIVVNALDSSGLALASVRLYLNDTLFKFFPGNDDPTDPRYATLFNVTALDGAGNRIYPDGDYILRAVATDLAGNAASREVDFQINTVNPPLSDASIIWTPAGPFAIGPVETQITAKIVGGGYDPFSVNGDTSLQVFITKDGVPDVRLPGTAQLTNGDTLRFIGTVPYNARVRCVLKTMDTTGKLIQATKNFISGMDSTLGGKVKFGDLTITFPPAALTEHALVEIVPLEAHQAPPPDGMATVFGPFSVVAANAVDEPLDLLNTFAQMSYSRSVAQIPANEQSFVERAQRYDFATAAWLSMGNDGGALNVQNGPAARTIIVPIRTFGVYRITTAPLPGDGITELFNYPNPFSPSEGGTDFSFLLGQPTNLRILIYDLLGNLVIRMDRTGVQGLNTVHWDGRNGEGKGVANGGYIAIFSSDDGHKARHKMGVAK